MGSDWQRVIGELSRGREVADQLRLMLRQSPIDSSATLVLPAQGLVSKILETFTHSLSILSAAAADSDEVSQLPPLKSEDSGESCKTPPPPTKDRRGCYKRRRSSETRTKDTASLFEDGHAWRKYGQKDILNAKHPRNYFRCTHKYDQGCQATKQVQKIEDDPPLFRTTYHGHHTCKNLFNPIISHHHINNITMDDNDNDNDNSPIMWSFATTTSHSDVSHPKSTTTCVLINDSSCTADVHINNADADAGGVKQENKELESQMIKPPPSSSSSSHDYFVCPDDHDDETSSLKKFKSAPYELGAFSPAGSNSDVYSCTESTHSMEMDIISMAVFDDFFDFKS